MRTLPSSFNLPLYLNLEARVFNQPVVLDQRQVCLPGNESFWYAGSGFPTWFSRNAAGLDRINLTDCAR